MKGTSIVERSGFGSDEEEITFDDDRLLAHSVVEKRKNTVY